MTETPVSAGRSDLESARTVSIIVYGLYLAALINGLTAIVGVILAYVKRNDVRGTIYESHLDNAIEVFWVSLVISIVAMLTIWFGVGVIIFIGLFIWFIYRTIKGLVRAIDARPYF